MFLLTALICVLIILMQNIFYSLFLLITINIFINRQTGLRRDMALGPTNNINAVFTIIIWPLESGLKTIIIRACQ